MIDVEKYWDERYRGGGNSGAGSRGEAARFKGGVVNRLIKENNIDSLLDMGCGDGYILENIDVPEYIGVDVSRFVLQICKERFPDRTFYHYSQALPSADMVLSMDVILHLTDDNEFEEYMRRLFALADKMVVLYTSDYDDNSGAAHVRHREVRKWIRENIDGWYVSHYYDSPVPDAISSADFYVYERTPNG